MLIFNVLLEYLGQRSDKDGFIIFADAGSGLPSSQPFCSTHFPLL
jgi:hypothetical protein